MYVASRQLLAQLILFSLLIPSISSAQVKLSQSEIFYRCYVKFFKSVVPRTDGLAKTLLQQVQEKKITGPEACVALLDQSQFVDLGTVVGPDSTALPRLSEKENEMLIKTFHNFHNSFFSKKSLDYVNQRTDSATLVVRDLDEPSLYFTRALFGNNVSIKTVFTSSHGLKGVRVTPKDAAGKMATRWQSKPFDIINESSYGPATAFKLSSGPNSNLRSVQLSDSDLVSFGKLIGVEKPISRIVPLVVVSNQSFSANVQDRTVITNELNTALTSQSQNLDISEHLGGGILGSQVFIMKNTNLTLAQVAPGPNNDKDHVIARRLSSRVFEDLLCHQLPTLDDKNISAPVAGATEAELKQFINMGSPHVIPNSVHGFRQNASCMACHTSLDPMAYVFRNLVGYRTSNNDNPPSVDEEAEKRIRSYGSPVGGITALKTIPNAKVFTLQTPTGGLNYRDHNGNTISRPVNGLSDLGAKLSESDDFFRCTTKRYYHFLTGYDVRLKKPDVDDPAYSEAMYHRDQIFKIAANLKKTGSMKAMIEDILKSEAFIYRNFQVAK